MTRYHTLFGFLTEHPVLRDDEWGGSSATISLAVDGETFELIDPIHYFNNYNNNRINLYDNILSKGNFVEVIFDTESNNDIFDITLYPHTVSPVHTDCTLNSPIDSQIIMHR